MEILGNNLILDYVRSQNNHKNYAINTLQTLVIHFKNEPLQWALKSSFYYS